MSDSLHEELNHEIEVREQTEQELAQAVRLLDEKNRDMIEYLSIITHDLKHPVLSVQTMQNLLKQRCGHQLAESERRYLDMSLSECERMMEMLSQLSHLARIERTQVTRERLDLHDFLTRCVNRFQGQCAKLACHVRISAPRQEVTFARQQVEESLNNLLDNAIKHGCGDAGQGPKETAQDAEQAGQIEVRGEISEGTCTIAVHDDGPGIESRHHQTVFQLFSRLQPDGPQDGAGVGLAAVRRLMQRIGGEVGVRSEPGRGTCFSLRFDVT